MLWILPSTRALNGWTTVEIAEAAYERAAERYHKALTGWSEDELAAARQDYLQARNVLRAARAWEAAA